MCIDKTLLSLRERKILCMMAKNHTNIEISKELFLSESTVKFSVRKILEKLSANGRVHAAVIGYKYGIIDID